MKETASQVRVASTTPPAFEDSYDSILDVLIAIDAKAIMDTIAVPSLDPKKPTWIGNTALICMVTQQGKSISGNTGAEMNLSATVGDVIRWRETTQALNYENQVLLYEYESDNPILSPPTPLLGQVDIPLPNPADPLNPNTQTVNSYFWQATVLKAGHVTYNFCFMITDRNGKALGYFYWDPFITIVNSPTSS